MYTMSRDECCRADGSGYGRENVVTDNGNLYDDIRQATADIEQLSLLGRQLDMPVIIETFTLLERYFQL